MVREILIWPDPILKKTASAVTRVDDSIRSLVNDMFETMYAADGVGLAAPQIGVLKQVIVLDTTPRQPESKPVAMINPQIIAKEGSTRYSEGCLSVPGEAEEVDRAAKVTVRDSRRTSFPTGGRARAGSPPREDLPPQASVAVPKRRETSPSPWRRGRPLPLRRGPRGSLPSTACCLPWRLSAD